MLKAVCEQFNILAQCRRSGLSLRQCPQFLFLIMGLSITISSVVFYIIEIRYVIEPAIVTLIILAVDAILFAITFVITRSLEELAEASRMKSEFINIVSHQLRSPLTNLKWTVELLTSKKFKRIGGKKEEYFNNLKENSNRMLELVNDLLIVSKIEQGTFPLARKETSLENLIKELISEFEIFAEASNVELKFYPQENLPKVFIDPSQMKIAIENLIDNAIRYTKSKGEVEIWLEKEGKNLHFKIRDTGVGIPGKEQKYIFQKFFRVENILKEQTQGSGLGLYITKSIIEKFGGKIWFESEEGKGTTFYFTLPIK